MGWIIAVICCSLIALVAAVWHRRKTNSDGVLQQLKQHRVNTAIENSAYAFAPGSSGLHRDEIVTERPMFSAGPGGNTTDGMALSNAVYAPHQGSDVVYAVPMETEGALTTQYAVLRPTYGLRGPSPQTVNVAPVAPPAVETVPTYAVPMEGAGGDTVVLAAYDTADVSASMYATAADAADLPVQSEYIEIEGDSDGSQPGPNQIRFVSDTLGVC